MLISSYLDHLITKLSLYEKEKNFKNLKIKFFVKLQLVISNEYVCSKEYKSISYNIFSNVFYTV